MYGKNEAINPCNVCFIVMPVKPGKIRNFKKWQIVNKKKIVRRVQGSLENDLG